MAITSVSELYSNYIPAFNNLYEVTLSSTSTNNNTVEDKMMEYIKLHAFSVTFGGESLSLERNPITKQFQLPSSESFKRSDTLTIEWRENSTWDVKKYHENWISKIYDKEKDCYKSYAINGTGENSVSNIYRTIIVALPNDGRQLKGDGSDIAIKFNNVIPQDIPGISLAWGTQSNIISHSINYYVTSWEWATITG